MQVFLGAMILANIAGEMHWSFLPLYLQSLGADVAKIGLFFTLSALMPLALQILGGWLSDSVGRLQAIAIGSLLGVLSYVVILMAPSWQWLLLAMAASSMCGAFVAPSYQAFIAEQSTEQTRGRVYGLVEGIYAVVGVVGPPIGGYLVERFSFRLMFVVAAALYLTATVVRLAMARGARRAETAANVAREAPTLKGLWTNLAAMTGLVLAGGLVTWIMLADGVRDIAFSLGRQLEPIYMQDVGGLSTSQIGWLVSIASFTTMVLDDAGGLAVRQKGRTAGHCGRLLCRGDGAAGLCEQPGLCGFCRGLGVVWVGRCAYPSGLQCPDLQGSSREAARHGLWPVLNQPGRHVAARALCRRAALAALWPGRPVLRADGGAAGLAAGDVG